MADQSGTYTGGFGSVDSQSVAGTGPDAGIYASAQSGGFDISDLFAWAGEAGQADPQTGWKPQPAAFVDTILSPAETAVMAPGAGNTPIHMPSYSIHWVGQNGYWNVASNWNLDRLPKSSDNVGINTASLYTVTFDTGTYKVSTLTVGNDDFVLSGGSLTITSGAGFANALTVSGGTLTIDVSAAIDSLSVSGGTLSLAGTSNTVSGAFTMNGGTLALGSNSATVEGLFTGGADGTVSGTGTLTLAGGAIFDCGQPYYGGGLLMTGNGTTILQGATALEPDQNGYSSTLYLDGGRVLENQGTLTETGNSVIVLGQNPFGTTLGGGTLDNTSSGTIDFDNGSFTEAVQAVSGATSFTNAGLVENTGSGETEIGVSFTNTGTVSVVAGQLDMDGGGTSTGTLTIASGGVLDFDSTNFSLDGGSISGAGTIEISGGTLSITGATTIGSASEVAGGTLAVGASATVSGLFTGGADGTVSGTGTLTLAGGAVFDCGQPYYGGGLLMTGSGTTILQGATALEPDQNGYSSTLYLDGGRVLENQGTLTETGNSVIALGQNPFGTTLGGGTLDNTSSGTVDFDNGSFTDAVQAGNGTTSFTNAGTVENTGSGETEIGVSFTNTGTVSVDQGDLQFGSSFTSSGTLSIGSGDILDLDGSGSTNYTLSGGTTSGAGAIELDDGTLSVTGTVSLSAALNLDGGALLVTGGASTARGLVTNDASIVVQGGQITLTGGIAGTGTVTIDSGAKFILSAASTTAANFVDVIAGTGTADLTGGSGNDVFQFAGNFQAGDAINGNGGSNTVILDGDYSGGLTFGSKTMTNIETLVLDSGYSYDLTLNKSTVAAGETVTVDASVLGSGNTLTLSGGSGTGTLVVFGGAGNDSLLGCKGDNVFVGGAGADTISCKNGVDDILVYNQASDSTSTGFDTVESGNAAKDQFSVFSQITNIDPMYKGGTLDAGNFDSDLANDLVGRLTANGAILYEATSGSYARTLFLIIDQNGQAGYQAGQDLVIEVPKFKGTLTTSNFLLNYTPPLPNIPNIGWGQTHGSGGGNPSEHAQGAHHLSDSFDWDKVFANLANPQVRAPVAHPAVVALGHPDSFACGQDGVGEHGTAGHFEAGYHSQLDALSAFGHHSGLTDQFALPHVEYFGT